MAKRPIIHAKLRIFYVVHWPQGRLYMGYPDLHGEYIAYVAPEHALAAAVKLQMKRDSDDPATWRPYCILKYIPIAIITPEYKQQRISASATAD